MVDTGGVYILDEIGEKYNSIPFTLSVEEKYKRYVKARFIFNIVEQSSLFSLISNNRVKNRRSKKIYNNYRAFRKR